MLRFICQTMSDSRTISLQKRAALLAEELRAFAKLVQDSPGEDPDAALVSVLQAPLCILTKMLIPSTFLLVYSHAERNNALTLCRCASEG